MQLSSTFIKNVSATFDGGEEWLASLPDLIAQCESRWAITVGAPFTLSYNFAAAASGANGEKLVLKLGVPRPELTREMQALRVYDGRGICRLIEVDEAIGALLLERVQPGDMLSTLGDPNEAARIGAIAMRQLQQPVPAQHGFRHVREWADGLGRLRVMFEGGTGPLPEHLVNSAETIFTHLFSTADNDVLLHGDLHHFNILSDSSSPLGWRVIDPKGMVGELGYETGTFIHNHYGVYGKRHNPAQLIDSCIEIISAELDIPARRIRQHAFAQSILSAFWTVEDIGNGWQPAIEFATLLHPSIY